MYLVITNVSDKYTAVTFIPESGDNTLTILTPEDGNSRFVSKSHKYLPHCTVLHHGKPSVTVI
jgi:hypothetical protein